MMAVTLAFCGCSKDDKTYSAADIVGEWYLSHEKGYYYWDEEKETYDDSYSMENTYKYFSFFSDKTFESLYIDGDEFAGTWNIGGTKLTLKYSDETESVTIKTLTSTTLVVYNKGTDEDGPWELTETYTRINRN